ncbi:hypothetical protein ZOSMA_12G00850 [Zostera marina]|uniref:Serine aminopeptidase S33 domain-containing protein n=1 Tax=Zostera marina TaxID=29655 RepID=A0A0K9Q1I3_ZOSMR|nr:hypothetical protein ZOSMA_12G00850 [Zostera marina]
MDRKVIDGATDEMNSIASQNLDHASARRQARQAFSIAQQNLDHLLLKGAPTGIVMEERYEKNSKGIEVFWKSWSPKTDVDVKGSLFFCHGYGDTCTFFFEGIAKWITDAGYEVYVMDYPGFGLSQGLHGYIPSFDGMVNQVIEQYDILKAKKEASEVPNFLLG